MTNDDDRFTQAKLPACFATSVSDLANMIHAAAQPGGSEGVAPRNAEAHLLTIRANAAKGVPSLYDALDAVRSAVRAVEDIARREPTLIPDHARLLVTAQTHALSALSFLIAVLCIAKPNARASASLSSRAAPWSATTSYGMLLRTPLDARAPAAVANAVRPPSTGST